MDLVPRLPRRHHRHRYRRGRRRHVCQNEQKESEEASQSSEEDGAFFLKPDERYFQNHVNVKFIYVHCIAFY